MLILDKKGVFEIMASIYHVDEIAVSETHASKIGYKGHCRIKEIEAM